MVAEPSVFGAESSGRFLGFFAWGDRGRAGVTFAKIGVRGLMEWRPAEKVPKFDG